MLKMEYVELWECLLIATLSVRCPYLVFVPVHSDISQYGYTRDMFYKIRTLAKMACGKVIFPIVFNILRGDVYLIAQYKIQVLGLGQYQSISIGYFV
jgi:hypothetical protein